MIKEYRANGDYIIIPICHSLETIHENFTTYINSPDDIKILETMTIPEIAEIILKSSIINGSSLLASISDVPENISRVSQILLQLPITHVYSIIPTMSIISKRISIPIIVTILLNMPISVIASIIGNMNIPQVITFPVTTNRSSILYLIKSELLSDINMPIDKAALILSDSNIPR